MEIGSIGGMQQAFQTNAMRPPGNRPPRDPAEKAEGMSGRIMEQNDADGDGLLSTDELGSSFDSDVLAALDTDEDGLLSQEELQSGIQSRLEEGRAAFESGSEPSAENRDFMQQMHSLAGDPPPNKAKATKAYGMMQQAMTDGYGESSSSDPDQLLLDSLNVAV